jgi:hypothetical protein
MRGSTGRRPLPPPGPAYPVRPRRSLAGGCLTALIIAVAVLALLLFVLTWAFRSSGTAGAESPALDGRLRFAITDTSCPKPAKAAAKRTCQVSVKVDNLGQEARVLYPGQQKLLDDDDAPYPGARLLDTAGKEITPIRIGPGDSFSGSLTFELPKEARPALLELHDSGLSSGVRVKLQ